MYVKAIQVLSVIAFPALCGGYIYGKTGTVLSPGFPDFYPNSLNCTWTVEVSHGKVQLLFHTFHLEDSHDYLLITEDGSFTELVARLTGSVLPPSIKAGLFGNFKYRLEPCEDPGVPAYSRRVGFQFGVGDSLVFSCFAGYRLEGVSEITCVQLNSRFFWQPDPPTSTCGGNVTGPAGVILSPNYPQPYPPGKECDWRIKVSPDFVIALIFKSFNMEPSYDFLHIYEGEDSNGPLIISLQGIQVPERIESSGNSLFLAFRSDASLGMSGFEIEHKILMTYLALRVSSKMWSNKMLSTRMSPE
uniref:Uncharacterized protein n=1 Tax=Sinocyclocheilus grahami TaxID=75366 RepID=A0A672SV79_SINGR